MKDYFSMQYSSIFENQIKGIQDISYFLKKFPMQKVCSYEDYFYAFENIKGEYISFGLHGEEFVYNIENEEILNILEKKYDIQNKLYSYYKNMIFHGIVKDERLYIFCVIYLENEFCPGLYETINLVSMLGLDYVPIVLTKIDINDTLNKNLVLTQKSGVDFNSKIFVLT